MKIGIITFHASHNCGSLLQAYALQKTLRDLGFENEIINFSNQGSKDMYAVIPHIHPFRRGVRGRIKKWLSSVRFYNILKRQSAYYESFKTKYLKVSYKEFHSSKELKNADLNYTHYITGSDQVWNICCPDADTAYYLDFVRYGKKIAYAVSTGSTIISEKAEEPTLYESLVRSFDAISVRERNSVSQFEKMTGRKDIELLIDPTLFLNQNDWEKSFDIEMPLINGKYIFYYAFHYDMKVNKVVKKVSDKLHMPVIILEAKAWGPAACRHEGMTLCKESGPIAFLNLIKHARLVLTTSFHGTVFSILFKKDFWFLESDMHHPMDDRASTLVDTLKIPERLINGEDLLKQEILSKPNYSGISITIKELQEKALAFLSRNLK